MFEPEVFREQMYCIEENICDFVGTFLRPPVIRLPRHFAPLAPSVRPWISPTKNPSATPVLSEQVASLIYQCVSDRAGPCKC